MAETLSLKQLQNHVIKTIVGSVVASVIVGCIGWFSFYYNTNASIERINEIQAATTAIVDKHTELINKAINSQGMNDVQQSAFNQRLNSIEENQKQIYNILLEINAGQKAIIKNNH